MRMSRIVELHDHGPLVIKKEEMEGNTVAVCRCGLSGQWPMCDGSHNETTDEGEATFAYRREGGELTREGVSIKNADPRA